jgi:hypothetical protein
MKLLVEANNILSLITGSSRDLTGMKDRVKRGYEGDDTAHVHAYDEPGFRPQDRSARIRLDAEDPPFSDISFDAVISGMTFGALPDQKLVVEAMLRASQTRRPCLRRCPWP